MIGAVGLIEMDIDPDRKLVRARMSGLLTVHEVEAFSRQEQSLVRGMGLSSGEFYLLVETEGNVVQTQEVMDAFHNLARHSELKAKRIATVRAGALARMQSRRLSDVRSDTEVFNDVASAEEWLFKA